MVQCLEFVGELLQQPSQQCQVFAVILTAHIVCAHSSLPQSLNAAQQVSIMSYQWPELPRSCILCPLDFRHFQSVNFLHIIDADCKLVNVYFPCAGGGTCISRTKQSSRVCQVFTRGSEPIGFVCRSLSTTDPSRCYHSSKLCPGWGSSDQVRAS